MIIPFVASLALLAPQEGRWVPTSVTPAVLAQRVDRRLATLSKATLSYQYDFEKSTVGRAFVICTGTIVSPGVFWLQVPKLDLTNAKEPMQRERWISDGKRFGMAAEPNEPKPGPIAKRPGVPSKPTQIWFSNFSRVIFSGLGQPVQPFAKLLGDAKRQGYVVSTKGRTITYQGRKVVSYQLLLTKGAARYEVVIDGAGYLPVTVLNSIGKDVTRWSAVKWNLRPGATLNPKNVRFKKQGAVRELSRAPR